MNTQDTESLKSQLIVDEGLKLKPYIDTVGKVTVGVGRNLTDVGLSNDEAMYLLDNDIQQVQSDLDRSIPWWTDMSGVRQQVLANMCFNMGVSRLMGFHNMLAAAESGNYDLAATEMLDSTWASQVGARAERLSVMMRTGGSHNNEVPDGVETLR
jgi:lysozyme